MDVNGGILGHTTLRVTIFHDCLRHATSGQKCFHCQQSLIYGVISLLTSCYHTTHLRKSIFCYNFFVTIVNLFCAGNQYNIIYKAIFKLLQGIVQNRLVLQQQILLCHLAVHALTAACCQNNCYMFHDYSPNLRFTLILSFTQLQIRHRI